MGRYVPAGKVRTSEEVCTRGKVRTSGEVRTRGKVRTRGEVLSTTTHPALWHLEYLMRSLCKTRCPQYQL